MTAYVGSIHTQGACRLDGDAPHHYGERENPGEHPVPLKVAHLGPERRHMPKRQETPAFLHGVQALNPPVGLLPSHRT